MDQQIGIQYQVKGADEVIAQNNRIIESFANLNKSMTGVMTAQGSYGSGIRDMAASVRNIGDIMKSLKTLSASNFKLGSIVSDSRPIEIAANRTSMLKRALDGLPEKASSAADAISKLSQAVSTYVGALGGAKAPALTIRQPKAGGGGGAGGGLPAVIPGVIPGGKGGGGSKGFLEDALGMAPMFLLRYKLWTAGMDAARYSATHLMLGRAREDLAKNLGELSAVSFSAKDKKLTENAAQNFAQQFWSVSASDYAKAMAQTASAFSIQDLGFGQMKRINEAAIGFSKLSQQSPEKAADLITSVIHSTLSFAAPGTRAIMEKGGAADIKGYGKVTMADLAEKIAAEGAMTIEKSRVWGSGLAGGFRHALPTLLQEGWTAAGAYSLIGALSDSGFQGPQSGRATKEMMTGLPEDMARAVLMGSGIWEDPLKHKLAGDSKAAQQANLYNQNNIRQIMPIIAQAFSSPEGVMGIMPHLGKFYQAARKLDKQAIKDMGFSKYFLQIFQTMMQPEFIERWKGLHEQIKNAQFPDMMQKAAQTLDDSGTAWARMTRGFEAFTTAIADHPFAHKIAEAVSTPLHKWAQMLRVSKMASRQNLTNTEFNAFLDEQQDFWEKAYGKDQARKMRQQAWGMKEGTFGMGNMALEVLGDLWKSDMAPWTGTRKMMEMPGFVTDFWGEQIRESGIGKAYVSMLETTDQWFASLGKIISQGQYVQSALDSAADAMSHFGSSVMAAIRSIPFVGKYLAPAEEGAITAPGQIGGGAPSVPDVSSLRGAAALQMSYDPSMPMAGGEGGVMVRCHVYLDGSEIRHVMQEEIEFNRTTNYQGFGGDPMGYNTQV